MFGLFNENKAVWEIESKERVLNFFPYISTFDRMYKCSYCGNVVSKQGLKRCPKCKSRMIEAE